VGTIANGETKDFPVSEGRHTIVAKIDFCSGPLPTFEYKEGETQTFLVGGFKNGHWLALLTLVLLVSHFILNSTLHFGYLKFLYLPPGLVIVYYLTFGRKDYLMPKVSH
jgi:hypothetical protein